MSQHDYIKILSGLASEEEQKQFYTLLENDPEVNEEYSELLKLWNLSRLDTIKISDTRKKELFKDFWHKANHRTRPHVIRKLFPVLRYAALIILAMAAGYLVSTLQTHRTEEPFSTEFASSSGSISSTTLEDGSYIWLNANTRLSVEQERKSIYAKLEGEAYFNVPHNPDREFIVEMGLIRVLDLGTEFNISAYPDQHISKVTLLEGDLDIIDLNGRLIRNLNPGETFSFDKTNNTYSVQKIDLSLITGWMDGKFVFIDRTLAEICEELEKWYGITIIIENQSMRDVKYTSVMKRTTTVKSVLEMMELTTRITYTIEEKKEGKDVIRLK